MKLSIIGTGYVGLVTGACFAEYGNQVVCVDHNKNVVELLQQGDIHIYEPNLKELVEQNLSKGTLSFTADIASAIKRADLCFICVGTPEGERGKSDLQYVRLVAQSIGEHMNHDIVVVNKSTVPVGTADLVRDIIKKALEKRGRIDLHLDVVSNPEFLKEGTAVFDCMRPDRIIVGVENPETGRLMHSLYKGFIKKSDSYFEMDTKSAEMTKYAANAMLAARISFMNEIANICERVGADVNKVRLGIGSDHRIGYAFTYPGVGYGGSCFPKDIRSLIAVAADVAYDAEILKAIDQVNIRQKHILFEKVLKHFGSDLGGLTFAVWGLSFKPHTDDIREAPALTIIENLLSAGANVKAYDPKAASNVKNTDLVRKHGLMLAENKYDALDGADALLLITEWKEFLNLDFTSVSARMKNRIIFDGRNQFDKELMGELGFKYFQVGVRSDFSTD